MKKKTGMLVGCVILLIILFLVWILVIKKVEDPGTGSSEKDNNTYTTITQYEEDDIQKVTYEIQGEKISYINNGETWDIENHEDFPLDQNKVETLIGRIQNLSANRTLEEVEDLSEYGLDNGKDIEITDKDGNITTLTVGNQNESNMMTYVQTEQSKQENTVYVVGEDFSGVFIESLMELAESDTFPVIDSTNVTQIDIRNLEGESYQIVPDEEKGWNVAESDGSCYSADDELISTLKSQVTSLSFTKLVDYSSENMKEYGLENPQKSIKIYYQEQEVELADEDENSEQTDESDEEPVMVDKEVELFVGNQNDEGEYYVKMNGSDQIHTIAATSLDEIFEKKAEEYWDLYIGMVDVATLTDINVMIDGQEMNIHRKVEKTENEDGEEEETVTYFWNEKELDTDIFVDFYQSVIGVKAQSKSFELKIPEKTDPEIKVDFVKENETISCSYYPYDSNFYLAVDTEGRYGLVNKNYVKEIKESFNQLQMNE